MNKKYIDGIVENLTLKQGLIRENGGFNLVDSYINMNFHNIRNVGLPKDEADAVPRRFVDSMIKEVEEKINKRKQLIAVHARYCGPLKEGDYPFKFGGGNSLENCRELIGGKIYSEEIKGLISGFVMPHPGYIRKTICEGVAYINLNTAADDIINSLNEKQINNLKLYYIKVDFKNDFIYDLKNKINFNIYSNKPIQDKKSFFEIVKIEKKYTKPATRTGLSLVDAFNILENLKPKLFERVLIQKFEWIQIVTSKDETPENYEVRLIMKISNNEFVRFENGETLNIRIPHFPDDLFLDENILDDVLKPAVMVLFSKLNFNFTFLIELDPL